eukprot:TRINITY_DN7271_c1_g1_i1.p1 TRINITY_DN7271_c1_g1~~TRINITY_DN7271_c1_g1_i1.p1  ORF type:complete len:373 (+),score=18.65 TRINITY_DN7271_c1_g1_i1:93-1211(+)
MSEKAVLGVCLTAIGGILNASWPLVTVDNAPRLLSATKTQIWQPENVYFSWGLFQLFVLYGWTTIVFGWNDFSGTINESGSKEIALVCIFSFVWGFGAYTYGLATKVAGPAIGISLIESTGQLLLLICAIILAICGFTLTAVAGLLKEKGISKDHMREQNKSVQDDQEALGTDVVTNTNRQNTQSKGNRSLNPSWFAIVLICVVSGVASSMLQFAFVFGENLIDKAEYKHNKSETHATLIVWVFAFSIEATMILIYSVYLLISNRTYRNFLNKYISWTEFLGNILKCFFMAVAFLAHIFLYGAAQAILGDLGAALAWPLLMISTVCAAQIWSLFLQEWKFASRLSRKVNFGSFLVLLLSATMIALAGCITFQ